MKYTYYYIHQIPFFLVDVIKKTIHPLFEAIECVCLNMLVYIRIINTSYIGGSTRLSYTLRRKEFRIGNNSN